MQDQPSPHSTATSLLCSPPTNASPAPSPHTAPGLPHAGMRCTGSGLSSQDQPLEGPGPIPGVSHWCPEFASSQLAASWGWCLKGTVQLVSRGLGGGGWALSSPGPPSRAAPNPTDPTRESHGIFLLTFLSSWRRVNNRPEGRMAGPQAATICHSGRPAASRLQADREIPHTSPQP